MTENQNTNQELSFTSKQLTDGMKKLIEIQGNSLCLHTGLTLKELYYSILTEFIGLLYDEEDKKNQRYHEYLKLKAEFEGTESAPAVKEQPKKSPWYPDDSGEWVENFGIDKFYPSGLYNKDKVFVLYQYERKRKSYCECVYDVQYLNWNTPKNSIYRIVAYKKVR